MGSQFGDSAFFLPSAAPDRVWVVDLDPRSGLVRAVREVTVDGVTRWRRRPSRPAAAAAGRGRRRAAARRRATASTSGIRATGRVCVTCPSTPAARARPARRVVPRAPTPTAASCGFTDVGDRSVRDVPAPPGTQFEPWNAAFSPTAACSRCRSARTRRGPRRLALVDVRRRPRRRRPGLGRPGRLHARRPGRRTAATCSSPAAARVAAPRVRLPPRHARARRRSTSASATSTTSPRSRRR